MDATDSQDMFSAIEAMLCSARGAKACEAARSYWRERPVITFREIGVLLDLMKEPRCAEHVARLLDSEPCEARQLLDAMVSVGMLEACPKGYTPTLPARLYCQWLVSNETS